jgi:hypothetical protein
MAIDHFADVLGRRRGSDRADSLLDSCRPSGEVEEMEGLWGGMEPLGGVALVFPEDLSAGQRLAAEAIIARALGSMRVDVPRHDALLIATTKGLPGLREAMAELSQAICGDSPLGVRAYIPELLLPEDEDALTSTMLLRRVDPLY